jgi:serine acetyltransferase
MPSLGVAGRAWRYLAAWAVHAAWRWTQRAGTVTAKTGVGRKFASFGPGSLLAFPTGTIYGEQWIEVGAGTMVGEQASICAGMSPGHDLGPETVLRIGDRCVIGRGSHIVAHQSIDIGDDVFTGPYVYITDQNHSYADPELPIGRQWPVNSPVSIGAGTWLGTGVIVLPGSVIGKNVVVAAGSVVRGEIGDRCVAAGVPARVVREFDAETGWTKPLTGRSEERIASLVNEALVTETLVDVALVNEALQDGDLLAEGSPG